MKERKDLLYKLKYRVSPDSQPAAKKRREGGETSDKEGQVHRRPYFSDGNQQPIRRSKWNPISGSTILLRTMHPTRPYGGEQNISTVNQLRSEMKTVRYVHSGASSSDSGTILPVAEQVTGAFLLDYQLTPILCLKFSVLEGKLLILGLL